MTLNSIDQALNVVLTGFIYGSGAWLACAFSFYVVRRQRQRKAARPMLLLAPAAELVAAKPFEEGDSLPEAASWVECMVEEDQSPSIEIIIEPPLLIVPSAPVESSVVTAEPSVVVVKPSIVTAESSAVESVKQVIENEGNDLAGQGLRGSFEMVCEPVDWKKWKVADLRRASIANVCGVRTRPIGSRRNLPKADLIAQYKQQLKRLTKSPPKLVLEKENVA